MINRVLQVSSNHANVLVDGEEIQCVLRGRFRKKVGRNANFLRVGDHVELSFDDQNTPVVEKVLPRKNAFFRLLPNSKEVKQIIAANIDQILLIVSVDDPPYKTGFIDRLTVLAASQEIDFILCINKSDLFRTLPDFIHEDIAFYASISSGVFLTSAEKGEGIAELKSALEGKTTTVVGPSGVGKSSLINTINPMLNITTQDVSDYSGKGQHTTTLSRFYQLNEHSAIIDTPGVRELGLVDMKKEELNLYFADFEEHRPQCKFYNCTHIKEPKCGVLAAIEQGNIYETRYYSYLSMFEELNERENTLF